MSDNIYQSLSEAYQELQEKWTAKGWEKESIGPRPSAKPKGNILDTFANAGSQQAKDIKSKLNNKTTPSASTGGAGGGGGGGGGGRTGGGGGGGRTGGGSSSSTSSSGGSSSSSGSSRGKQDYGSKSANMSAWAKANPKLAAKVKPGQSGHKEIQSSNAKANTGTKSSPVSGSGRQALSMASKSSPSSSSSSSSSSSASGIKSPRLAKALGSVGKFKSENFEMLIGYLMDEGYANNEVSAEVILDHMSDDWAEYLWDNMTD